ncbi:MAG: hypothetical protein HOM21_02495 [Halobacteriovoraceae bacterium]|nr:hypothetical protein [Halobacteriovoraceae bacterium]
MKNLKRLHHYTLCFVLFFSSLPMDAFAVGESPAGVVEGVVHVMDDNEKDIALNCYGEANSAVKDQEKNANGADVELTEEEAFLKQQIEGKIDLLYNPESGLCWNRDAAGNRKGDEMVRAVGIHKPLKDPTTNRILEDFQDFKERAAKPVIYPRQSKYGTKLNELQESKSKDKENPTDVVDCQGFHDDMKFKERCLDPDSGGLEGLLKCAIYNEEQEMDLLKGAPTEIIENWEKLKARQLSCGGLNKPVEKRKLDAAECAKEMACNIGRSLFGLIPGLGAYAKMEQTGQSIAGESGKPGFVQKQMASAVSSVLGMSPEDAQKCTDMGQSDCIGNLAKGILQNLWGLVDIIWKGVNWVFKKGLPAIGEAIGDEIYELYDKGFGAYVGGKVDAMADFAVNIGSKISHFASRAITDAKDAVVVGAQYAANKIESLGSDAWRGAKIAWSWITDDDEAHNRKVSQIMRERQKHMNRLEGELKDVRSQWKGLKKKGNVFVKMTDKITGAMGKAKKFMSGFVDHIGKAMNESYGCTQWAVGYEKEVQTGTDEFGAPIMKTKTFPWKPNGQAINIPVEATPLLTAAGDIMDNGVGSLDAATHLLGAGVAEKYKKANPGKPAPYCTKPMSDECADCSQAMNKVCGVAGFIIGEIPSAMLTGGVATALSKGATTAKNLGVAGVKMIERMGAAGRLAAKGLRGMGHLAGVAGGATKAGLGRVLGSMMKGGGKLLKFADKATNLIPGAKLVKSVAGTVIGKPLQAYAKLTEAAFMRGMGKKAYSQWKAGQAAMKAEKAAAKIAEGLDTAKKDANALQIINGGKGRANKLKGIQAQGRTLNPEQAKFLDDFKVAEATIDSARDVGKLQSRLNQGQKLSKDELAKIASHEKSLAIDAKKAGKIEVRLQKGKKVSDADRAFLQEHKLKSAVNEQTLKAQTHLDDAKAAAKLEQKLKGNTKLTRKEKSFLTKFNKQKKVRADFAQKLEVKLQKGRNELTKQAREIRGRVQKIESGAGKRMADIEKRLADGGEAAKLNKADLKFVDDFKAGKFKSKNLLKSDEARLLDDIKAGNVEHRILNADERAFRAQFKAADGQKPAKTITQQIAREKKVIKGRIAEGEADLILQRRVANESKIKEAEILRDTYQAKKTKLSSQQKAYKAGVADDIDAIKLKRKSGEKLSFREKRRLKAYQKKINGFRKENLAIAEEIAQQSKIIKTATTELRGVTKAAAEAEVWAAKAGYSADEIQKAKAMMLKICK